jgi:hypothetical protein
MLAKAIASLKEWSGVLALFVALGGTAYAATGGNFILGQSNSASKPTRLNSGSLDSALKVTDTRTGTGVWASGGSHADNTAAVHGESANGNAVEGFSTADPASGLYGQDNNANSYGVAGHSDNGVAVVGDSSNGWAVQALGNTAQTRAANGFVKAMAFIDPVGGGDAIHQCFNSQLPPSQATDLNCGISYTPGNGTVGAHDVIGFGFKVNDRFVSATERTSEGVTLTVFPLSSNANAVGVSPIGNGGENLSGNNGYWIIVY